jgi:hypothetical protein
MAGGRPRKPTDRDYPAEELIQQAVEQLVAASTSPRKSAGSTTAEVSPHLARAVSAARLAAAAGRLARHYVDLAREVEGATWEQVGGAFGTSRQSAHERFQSGSAETRSRGHRAPISAAGRE